jgi:GMP synthase-like glutamine amidotransferase
VLSGGALPVYGLDATHVDRAVFELGVPTPGICYGLQEVAWHFWDERSRWREEEKYGEDHVDRLFQALATTFPYGCRMETHHLDFQITSGLEPRP